MHLEYFKIFSDLVAKRSFSEASKLNGITQSALNLKISHTVEILLSFTEKGKF